MAPSTHLRSRFYYNWAHYTQRSMKSYIHSFFVYFPIKLIRRAKDCVSTTTHQTSITDILHWLWYSYTQFYLKSIRQHPFERMLFPVYSMHMKEDTDALTLIAYKDNGDKRLLVRRVAVLHLVPPELVEDASFTALEDFKEIFLQWWSMPNFKLLLWSMFR